MTGKHGLYVYEIDTDSSRLYTYKLKGLRSEDEDIDSHDWFETAQEARFAAVGHIVMLTKNH